MSDRAPDSLRSVTIEPCYTSNPAASVLICAGETRVMCTCSVDLSVPPFRADKGGWLTAEYSMLPGSTPRRVRRASSKGRPDGRATEIQRLIGRSLRAAFDLDALGEHTLWIDCDVLQADGGTRTASITGGYVAARLAFERLANEGRVDRKALLAPVAAVSVGIIDGVPRLDLDYVLDSRAEVDLNVVMAGDRFVEVQGTAEGKPFERSDLDTLVDLAGKGIRELYALQQAAIAKGLELRPRR